MTARLREATLWAGAVVGLLSVVAGTAVGFFGFTFLIFRSGSMGPDIPTGSLALAHTVPAADLEPGDVVSVIAANGARVTHRLVSSTLRGDTGSLILQGDANGTPDEEIYQVTQAERSIASLPYAGYLATVLLSPAGLVAVGCLSGMLVLTGFSTSTKPSIDRPGGAPSAPRGGRHRARTVRDPRRTAGAAAVGVALVASVTVAGAGVDPTSAFFTDKATLRSGSFTSGNLAAPTGVRCVDNGNLDYINWAAPGGVVPTGYRVFYSSLLTSGSEDVAGLVNYQPPATVVLTTYTITVAALYRNWVSPVSTTSASIRVDRAAPNTRYRC